jgi:transcriptional regulator with XRE-family HTH domain
VKDLGSRIKKLREEAGLTQRDLAKRLKLTQPAIVQWESGDTSPLMGKLPKIAKALGVSVEELMFGERAA